MSFKIHWAREGKVPPPWETYSLQIFPCYHLFLASLQSKEPMHWISLFISYLVIKQELISFPLKIVFYQTALGENALLLRLQHQIEMPMFWNSVQRPFCIHSIYFCNPQYNTPQHPEQLSPVGCSWGVSFCVKFWCFSMENLTALDL